MRLATKPPLRRDAAAHPALAAALAGALFLGAALLLWATAAWPLVRHLAAALALATLLALAWRARPAYGARRGWPPGSLGLGESLDAIDDRRYYRDRAARYGPIFKTSQFGRPVACVVGHDRARRILVEHADALAPATLPYNRLLTKGVLRYMSGADHREEAPVFRAAFARMDVAGAEASLRASLRRELARLSEASLRDDGGAYAREAFERWIVGAIARLFLGIEPDDGRVAAIARELPGSRSTAPAVRAGAASSWRASRRSRRSCAGSTGTPRRARRASRPARRSPCSPHPSPMRSTSPRASRTS